MVVPLAVLTRVRVAADVFADRNAPSLSSRGARIYRQGGRAAQAIRRGGARRLPRPAFADKSGRMVRPATNARLCPARFDRSEEHTSELQSLMRISYAVFCLTKKRTHNQTIHQH